MSFPQKLLITGGTGLVGKKLINSCSQELLITSRNPERAAGSLSDSERQRIRFLKWDGASLLPPTELAGVDAVVHLAGDSVAEGRWNAEKKQRIRDSRILGTRCLVKSLAALERPPQVLVSASAVGYYGHRPREILTEQSEPGNGFLPEVCVEWESAALAARDLGIRVCCLRIGIVMASQGGALEKMLPIYRWGLGGPLGTGRQYFPWVHIEDLIGLIRHCLQTTSIQGPVNAVAPTATTQFQFAKVLGKVLGRPTFLPAPKFGLRVLLGEFANSLFDSQQVRPQVALDSGFQFKYPSLPEALANLLAKESQSLTQF